MNNIKKGIKDIKAQRIYTTRARRFEKRNARPDSTPPYKSHDTHNTSRRRCAHARVASRPRGAAECTQQRDVGRRRRRLRTPLAAEYVLLGHHRSHRMSTPPAATCTIRGRLVSSTTPSRGWKRRTSPLVGAVHAHAEADVLDVGISSST